MKETDKTKYEIWRDLRKGQAEMAYHLEVFGDHLAKREGYKEHEGLEALHFYLIQKHHWLPSEVRALNWEDLRFILKEEMADWILPDEAT
jgi:hypothetical protein